MIRVGEVEPTPELIPVFVEIPAPTAENPDATKEVGFKVEKGAKLSVILEKAGATNISKDGFKHIAWAIAYEDGGETTLKLGKDMAIDKTAVISPIWEKVEQPEPTAKPTEPTVQPTEPSVEPTEPTEPSPEPTTKPTKPTEPSEKPTEPTTKSTVTTPKSTEPTPKSTKTTKTTGKPVVTATTTTTTTATTTTTTTSSAKTSQVPETGEAAPVATAAALILMAGVTAIVLKKRSNVEG